MSGTNDPKQLIARILGATPRTGESAAESAPFSPPGAESGPDGANRAQAADAVPVPSDEAVSDLIELYFTLEEPDERDVVFDRLAAVDNDATTEFFAAMMAHDEDSYMRRAASAELARRGHPEALDTLQDDLATNADPLAFEHALETLAAIEGEKFVPVVVAICKDTSRNSLQRRTAMSVLEGLDTPRAMAAFIAFVEGISDVKNFADDILEQAMAAFGRQNHQAAVPALQGLQARMAAASWDDEEEKLEAIAFVGEGLALLSD